jgi:large subunit ribosomal protein L5
MTTTTTDVRLKARYKSEIQATLKGEFGYKNPMQIPTLVKKPQVTKSRKSIAQFKLRENMPIGAHVTLRGDRMWEFADRLLSISLPRIRDFRGLSPKQFDGKGNYTFGLTEQVVFPEIEQDKIDRTRGMDITVVTTAKNDDEGRALLKALGFPFKEA